MKITKKLIEQVADAAYLEEKIASLLEELKPIKDKLKKKFKYGVFCVGDYTVTKTRVDSCVIPEHKRQSYDQLTIK